MVYYYTTYGIPGTTYIYLLLCRYLLYIQYKMASYWYRFLHYMTSARTYTGRKRYYVYGLHGKESSIKIKRSHTITQFVRSTSQTRTTCLASIYGLATEHSWLGIDTFSTFCMTNSSTDFEGNPKKTHKKVTGVLGEEQKATITLHGPGNFFIMDDAGEICKIYIPDLYYCETVPYRLLSPQHIDRVWKENKMGSMKSTTDNTGTVLQWTDTTGTAHVKTIPHTSISHLPICYTAPSYREYSDFLRSYHDQEDDRLCACMAHVQPHDTTQDLVQPVTSLNAEIETTDTSTATMDSTPQIFDIQTDFNHIDTTRKVDEDNFATMDPITQKLFWHYKLGHLPFKALNRLSATGQIPRKLHKIMDPKCAACLYGQSTKRPWRTKTKPNAISDLTTITKPGDCVSVDQMVSPVPGLIAQLKGYPTKERYNAATIFVDHYSDLTFCHLQINVGAKETINAKEAFERYCNSNGVMVRHYHADNGRFAETAFMAHVAARGQTISFCGVNAHFQNGKAERRIRTIQDIARTQLLHAIRKWPVAITAHIWPYAVTNAVNVLNDTPTKMDDTTRIQKFSGSPISPNINHHHHIGIPVYVLDDNLQSGKKIPKWFSRARVGIYLGKSPRHARNVSLVLNPRTGMTSPQYHMTFDDNFDTVRELKEDSHGWWLQKCGFSTTNKVWPTLDLTTTQQNTTQPETPANISEIEQTTDLNEEERDFVMADPFEAPIELNNTTNVQAPEVTQPEGAHVQLPTRRSNRAWKPTTKYLESLQQNEVALPVCLQAAVYDDEYETIIDNINPMSLLAQTDADTMYWDQALAQPDADQFIEAAILEVQTHEENGHWIVVPLREIPPKTKVLDSVWSMKRKRRVKTNEVYKHKARLNVHGGQQELGVNYWETYAPVVTWAAIRMILILVILYGWYTVQIDFVLAYPQAKVECDLYMKIPKGFEIQGKTRQTHALKLIQNLYGQKQAGRIWNQHLHDKLLSLGWEQSKADDCLYYNGDVLFIVYVDDGILVSPNQQHIDEQLYKIKQHFNISVEGTLADYVGVNIEKQQDGSFNMTQPNIIKSILHELNFVENTKSQLIPASGGTIVKDGADQEPHKADWSYRRIIGKLNFLASSCRPELSCIVHQCARFSSDPRTNHTEAIKQIARYLKGTENNGIKLQPTDNKFKVYVDADFGGLWDKEIAADRPITSKSRTGYVVTYADCPIVWASQLQTEIALSTTEAEYIAMSTALRHTIPIMRLVKEIGRRFNLPLETKPTILCTVFEDNAGAVELANVPKLRPRTRHINTKYHHFRKYVFDGKIKIQYIPTAEQLADIFTKNLPRDTFLSHRKSINGW